MSQKYFSKYLEPKVLSNINSLELIAKLVVEGFITGLHKSPFHGFSVEFSQHKAYMPGDSLRFIDWKVYGRTDRYYIKQFEEETNLRAHILLDVSRSMLYGSSEITKAKYASYLAASLAYLLIQQRDAAGLVMFDENVRLKLPPKSVISYIDIILREIDNIKHGTDTNISSALHQTAERVKRRSLIILISDLLDSADDIIAGLKHFRHDKHEVLVFHIIDPQEFSFAFKGDTIFEDLESGEKIKTQPDFIKTNYTAEYESHLKQLSIQMRNNRIDYQQLFTDTPFNTALTQYLLKRKKLF